MGLGAPKSRSKLSHDPNNTAWARSTDNYGRRILSSQGWKTGDYLGANNASHADHYTAANASHIRVLLREDNLGLGAKVGGKSNAETFGLSTLSGIFGRLNGKSEVDVEKQQSSLRDAELRTYQAQKHGFMNFVRGGLLVGDKIEEVSEKQISAKTANGPSAGVDEETKGSKKRKAERDAPQSAEDGARIKKQRSRTEKEPVSRSDEDKAASAVETGQTKQRKKRRHEKETSAALTPVNQAEVGAADRDGDVEKAAKRQRKEHRRTERAVRKANGDSTEDEKARLKQEKRARKEERRKRKDEKRRVKALQDESDDESVSTTPTTVATADPTPVVSEMSSGTATPLAFGGGRRAIRQRYIMQKRMASMDPKALNEILMIKTQG
ncbi:telomerase inhibitor [Teratosphaeriaceae sp. CCFEE 6253]|nr:telomerase inhibitor [Teratosphaeriaceae sp. CCFEE 6253]